MKEIKINPKYEYEDNDVDKLLSLILQSLNLQNVCSIAPIDNVHDDSINLQNNQLVIHLQEERERYNAQRTLLVPYNLNRNHWVGIVIHYQSQNIVERIDYIDSLGGQIPDSVLRNLRFSFSANVNIQKVDGLIQQDATSCGALMVENMLYIVNGNITRFVCNQQAIMYIRLQHQELLDNYAPELNFGYRQEHNIRSFSYEAEICEIEELDISEQDEQILQEDQKKIAEMIILCDQILEDCSSNPALLEHQAIEDALHTQSLMAFGEPGYYEEAFNYASGQGEEKTNIFPDDYEEGFDDESYYDEMLNDYFRKTLEIETPKTRRIVDTRSTLTNLRRICQLSEKISWTIKNNPKNKNIPWHHLESFGEILVAITEHYKFSNNMRRYVIIDVIQDQEHGLRSLREALNNILQNSQNGIPVANLIKKFTGFFYDLQVCEDFDKRLQSLSVTTSSDKVKQLSRLRLMQLSGEHLKRSIFVEAEGKIELYDARDKLSKLGTEELPQLLDFIRDQSRADFLGFDVIGTQIKFQQKFDSSKQKTLPILTEEHSPEELWKKIKTLELDTGQKILKAKVTAVQTADQNKKSDKKSRDKKIKTDEEKLADELVDRMIPYPNQDNGLDKVPAIQGLLKEILGDVGDNIKSFEEFKFRIATLKLDHFNYEEHYAEQQNAEYKTLCEEIRKNRREFSTNNNLLDKAIKKITEGNKILTDNIKRILNHNPNINKENFEQELLQHIDLTGDQSNALPEILSISKRQIELSKDFKQQKIDLINKSKYLSEYEEIYNRLKDCNDKIKQKGEELKQKIEKIIGVDKDIKAKTGKLKKYFESPDYDFTGLGKKLEELSITFEDIDIIELDNTAKEIGEIKSQREKINIDQQFFATNNFDEYKDDLLKREKLKEKRNNLKVFLLGTKKIDEKNDYKKIEAEYNKFLKELKRIGISFDESYYHQEKCGPLEKLFCKLVEVNPETHDSKQRRRIDRIKLVHKLILELKDIIGVTGYDIDSEISRENGFSDLALSPAGRRDIKDQCLREATFGFHTISIMQDGHPVLERIKSDQTLCQAVEFLIITITQPILSELQFFPELSQTKFDNRMRNYFSHPDARYKDPLIREITSIVVINNPPKTVAQIAAELCVVYDFILDQAIRSRVPDNSPSPKQSVKPERTIF